MSSDQQNERSPDQQFQTIAGTLQRLGRPWVHVQDYRDVGVSGRRHDGRPGFMAMLEDIASGRVRVDAILVENLDRFGRNDVSLASRQSLARDHGVLVLTADANFSDPDTPQGQAFGFIESIRATGESRVRAMYVLRGKKDSAQRGRWPGGPFPLGYRPKPVLEERGNGRVVKSSLLEVDPVGAAVVRLAFQAAYEQGWGQDRIAAHLNERPDVPEEFKPVRGSTIGRILDRELYIGTLAWNSVCTDIVADHRVTQRNPEDEIIRIPGFCEPIVEREVWEAVRRMRQERGTPGRKARRERDPFAGKEIQPTTPGGALQYPLTGLVVCAVCGSAMIANGGGAYRPASGEVRRYVRYVCPGRVCRACPNAVRIPEPKLREAVVDRLRRRLLPIPDEELGGSARLNASMVENCQWFQELLAETQREAERLSQADGPELPAVEAALAVLEERRVGWRQSLGNSKLAPAVREELEAAAAADAAERERLEGRRRDLLQAAERNRRLITAADVAERLNRLAEMLAGGNATLANIVLAEHIERIEVHPDGRVVMRTCRLGSVEGVADLFADEAADAASAPATVGTPRVRPRRRSRRRTGDAVPSGVAFRALDPQRFGGLHPRWFWIDEFRVDLRSPSWARTHAQAVAARRREGRLSLERLAQEFGKTKPTIRAALECHLAEHPDERKELLRSRRSRPKPRIDYEALAPRAKALWEADRSELSIAKELDCSPQSVQEMLRRAYATIGEAPPTRNEIRERQAARVRTLRDQGRSFSEIAAAFHISTATVHERLKASYAADGVTMPDQRRRGARRQGSVAT